MVAGYSPREILSWTWPEVQFAAQSMQVFLVDTVTMFVTGKSPVMKAAQQAYRERVDAAKLAVDLKANRGTELSNEDAVKIAQDYGALGALARLGVGISFTGGEDTHLQTHLERSAAAPGREAQAEAAERAAKPPGPVGGDRNG